MAGETSHAPPAVRASTSGSRNVSTLISDNTAGAAQTLASEVSFGEIFGGCRFSPPRWSREPPVKLDDQPCDQAEGL